jgi:hypothetical protein
VLPRCHHIPLCHASRPQDSRSTSLNRVSLNHAVLIKVASSAIVSCTVHLILFFSPARPHARPPRCSPGPKLPMPMSQPAPQEPFVWVTTQPELEPTRSAVYARHHRAPIVPRPLVLTPDTDSAAGTHTPFQCCPRAATHTLSR